MVNRLKYKKTNTKFKVNFAAKQTMNVFYVKIGLNDTVRLSHAQRVLLNGECRSFSTVCRMMYFTGANSA